jgi:hypothetical protein
VEQRFHAVIEVHGGSSKTDVAARYGVSRQTVHSWTLRYERDGLGGLADRSHRPSSCPHRVDAEVEALACTLRTDHPRWGPRRLRHEVGKRGCAPGAGSGNDLPDPDPQQPDQPRPAKAAPRDGQAVIAAVPRQSTTEVNRFRAKHQIRP